ncbi:MAG: sulfatase [Planctomycetota bacterium]
MPAPTMSGLLVQRAVLLAAALLFGSPAFASEEGKTAPPNIVMFVADDLNDWVSAMGYSQAITPNLDRLAKRGVMFTNAHAPATFCTPSRTAIITGRHASTTGCYRDQVYHFSHPDIQPLQVTFQKSGYATFGGGKIFHHRPGYVDLRGWDEFFVRSKWHRENGWWLKTWHDDSPFPQPHPSSPYNEGRQVTGGLFLEWGKVPNDKEEEMADTIRTNWACDVIKKKHDKPFFLAVGLYCPHFPNYAPEKYFDLYDRDKIVTPVLPEDDLDDIPEPMRKQKINRSKIQQRLDELGVYKDAVQGYLASVSYADAMLGRVLDAIDESGQADNTIVVFWSDHGYHLGEKGHWGKHALWERTTNVPFIWAGPGIPQDQQVDTTVSLIDMYPTFTELCKLEKVDELEGTSIAGVLRDPSTATDRSVFVPYMMPDSYAIVNQDWRYIRYDNGTEELYDVRNDPNEWTNLAGDPKRRSVIDELTGKAPKTFAKPEPNFPELRLITEGETFRWELKKQKKKKPN